MPDGEHSDDELRLQRAELAESKKLYKELIAHHGTLRWNTFWTALGAVSGVGAIVLALVLILFF